MNTFKNFIIGAGLIVASSSVNATIIGDARTIDFQDLADGIAGGPGEGGYSTLMFDYDANLVTSGAFLKITGTEGGNAAFAYLDEVNSDERRGGLGVCTTLDGDADGTGQCAPTSDDNVSGGQLDASGNDLGAEFLHFAFGGHVIIDKIFFNNNHDGDKSLIGDTVLFGVGNGPLTSTALVGGGTACGGCDKDGDSWLSFGPLGLDLINGGTLNIGYDPAGSSTCQTDNGLENGYCEFYISQIEYRVPEPTMLALLGIGLLGMGAVRRRLK